MVPSIIIQHEKIFKNYKRLLFKNIQKDKLQYGVNKCLFYTFFLYTNQFFYWMTSFGHLLIRANQLTFIGADPTPDQQNFAGVESAALNLDPDSTLHTYLPPLAFVLNIIIKN